MFVIIPKTLYLWLLILHHCRLVLSYEDKNRQNKKVSFKSSKKRIFKKGLETHYCGILQ